MQWKEISREQQTLEGGRDTHTYTKWIENKRTKTSPKGQALALVVLGVSRPLINSQKKIIKKKNNQ